MNITDSIRYIGVDDTDIDLAEPMVTLRSTMKPTDLPAMEALAEAILG